jgi:Bacterial Ig-like domain (group 2)/FG-GAP-like repeat
VFSQIKLLLALAALTVISSCGGGGNSTPPPVTIGGTVSGLASGVQLVLSNGGNSTTITANGAFTLTGTVPYNGSYAVTVGAQPAGQNCTVSGGSGSSVTTNVSSVSVSCISIGQFIDAPVAGLAYTCTSASGSPAANNGTTNAQGQFQFAVGQSCTFKVGNVTVGTLSNIPSDNIVTPQDLAGVIRSVTTSPAALAIAQFLQSLDDGSGSGTITIPAAVSTALNAVSATSIASATSGVLSQAALTALVKAAGKSSLVSPSTAGAALQQEITNGRVKTASGSVTAATPVTLSSVVLSATNPTNASVADGLSGAVTATGHYSDGTTKDLTSSASWSSSNTSVASVSAGTVTGVTQGTVTLSAQSAGVTGTLAYQVTPAVLQTLSLTPSSASVVAGKTTSLVLTGTYSDNSKSTSLGTVSWSSSAQGTASVDTSGTVTGVAAGTATITAAVGSVTTSIAVTVLEPTITSIVISAVSNAVQVGSTLVLNALANLSNYTQKNVSALVSWIVNWVSGGSGSDATTVATIATDATAGTATLTGTGVGTVSVSATYQGMASNAVSVESSGPFAMTPKVLPDLEPIYASFCPTSSRSLQNVVPIDLNNDGKMDLILMMWCSPISGAQAHYDGPTPSRLIALVQDSNGNFSNKTEEVLGSANIIPGGTGEYFTIGDFNNDGKPDIVWDLGREDNRLQKVTFEETQNYPLGFGIMSQADGWYRPFWVGKGWGFGILSVDNKIGGQDFIITSASQSSQRWSFDPANGFVMIPGFDWVSADTIFLPSSINNGAPSAAITDILSRTQIGVSLKKIENGVWVDSGGFYYPNYPDFAQKLCCGNANPSGANFTRIDGKDYIDPSFGQSCKLKRYPSGDIEMLTVFDGQEVLGGYNGQVIVYDQGTLELYKIMAFSIGSAGTLSRNELIIKNEVTRDVKSNRLACLDTNNDGYDDIILFISKNNQTPVIYLNDQAGGFGRVNSTVFPGSPVDPGYGLSNYIFADLDGDGIMDLIYFPIVGNSGNNIQIKVHKGLRKIDKGDLMP